MMSMLFVIKQKTADEMRISDWSSDVCSSDLYLLQEWPGSGESRPREPSGLEEVGRRHAAATCGQAGLRERAEDDVGKHREAVQDERERADVEDLLEEAADHIVVAAHRPEESGERDVDADQRHGQEVDVAAEQTEASVDVGDERSEEHTSERQSLMRISYAVL